MEEDVISVLVQSWPRAARSWPCRGLRRESVSTLLIFSSLINSECHVVHTGTARGASAGRRTRQGEPGSTSRYWTWRAHAAHLWQWQEGMETLTMRSVFYTGIQYKLPINCVDVIHYAAVVLGCFSYVQLLCEPMNPSLPGSSILMEFPREEYQLGCLLILRGSFLIQGM